jgi:geranylgeranyl diphosphate synthase type 3
MQYTENKTYCEDLSEGKFSFPIIHAITNNPNNKEIQCTLWQILFAKLIKSISINALIYLARKIVLYL